MSRFHCFICERAFAETEEPAEIWAEEHRVICICSRCVSGPPGGLHSANHSMPASLEKPLQVRLYSLALRGQSVEARDRSAAIRERSQCALARSGAALSRAAGIADRFLAAQYRYKQLQTG